MRKRMAIVLALAMLFGTIIPWWTAPVRAEEPAEEYIVSIRVDKVTGEMPASLASGDYDARIEAIERGLDTALRDIRSKVGDVEEVGRLNFLLSALVLRMTASQKDAVTALPYVEYAEENRMIDVELVPRNRVRMTSSPEIIGIDPSVRAKYDGQNQVVGILDNNFNPFHRVFYLDKGVKTKLSKEMVEGARGHYRARTGDKKIWYSEKVPFAWNYYLESDQLNPYKEKAAHGQHVASTAAGNRYTIHDLEWCGIAPNAQVLMMHVFQNRLNSDGSVSSGTNSSVYIKAIEDAVYLRASVLNMSLGSPKGSKLTQFSLDRAVSTAIDRAVSVGTSVAIAAGNEGEYKSQISPAYPDYGAVGSPGINPGAITVASVENTMIYVQTVEAGDRKIEIRSPEDRQIPLGSYPFVDCGLGKPEDFEGKDLQGKIALIRRGELTFVQKITNAKNAGATAAIIYNNVPGALGMALGGAPDLPAGSITQADGEFLIAHPELEIRVVTHDPVPMPSPTAGELSGFSNWGLTIDGEFKPDVTAPGGNIYAANTTEAGFGNMSGTSMATPHVTGCVALLRQYMDSDPKFQGMTVAEKGKLVKVLLMNSAVPFVERGREAVASPRKQGAGVVNMKNATTLDYTVTDQASGLAAATLLGPNGDTLHFALRFTNLSSETKTLRAAVTAVYDEVRDKVLSYKTSELFNRDLDEAIVIPPHGTVERTIEVKLTNLEALAAFPNGAFVDGFLSFRDEAQHTASFPFVSFVRGDYKNLPALEKPIYDMDFTREKPMNWGYAPKNAPWYRLSTHLESKVNGKEVLLGLENPEDFPGQGEPTPKFGRIYVSPNGDGKADDLIAYAVVARQMELSTEIVDASGKATTVMRKKVVKPSISMDPSGSFSDNYVGSIAAGTAALRNLKDGAYTFAYVGKPTHEGAQEQRTEIPFVIDTLAPSIEQGKLSEDGKTLTFRVVEAGELQKLVLRYPENGAQKEIALTPEDGVVKVTLPEGVAKSDMVLYAQDKAYNESETTVDMLLETGETGSIRIDLVTVPAGVDTSKVKYHVEDAEGNTLRNLSKVRFGTYTLKVTEVPEELELEGEPTRTIVVQSTEPTVETLRLRKLELYGVTIIVNVPEGFAPSRLHGTLTHRTTGKKTALAPSTFLPTWLDAKVVSGTYDLTWTIDDNAEKYIVDGPSAIVVEKTSVLERATVTKGGAGIVIITEGLSADPPAYSVYDERWNLRDPKTVEPGKYYVYPNTVPGGYYVDPRYQVVTVPESGEAVKAVFRYLPSAGVVRRLTIRSDRPNERYDVANFEQEMELEGGKTYRYEEGMTLPPDVYYVTGKATDTHYPVFMEGGKEIGKTAEVDLTKGDGTLDVTWKAFSDLGTEPREVEVYLTADDYPVETSHPLTFTQGEKTVRANVSFLNPTVALSPGAWTVRYANIRPGDRLDPEVIHVTEAGEKFWLSIVPDTAEDTVRVRVHFVADGAEVPGVRFTLDGKTYAAGTVDLPKGTYDLVVTEAPAGYRQKNPKDSVTIDDATKDIEIAMVQEGPAGIPVTLTYKDPMLGYPRAKVNWTITATGADGKVYTALHDEAATRFTVSLPKGVYTFRITSNDGKTVPAYNIYENQTIDDAHHAIDLEYAYLVQPMEVKSVFADGANLPVTYLLTKQKSRYSNDIRAEYPPALAPDSSGYTLAPTAVPQGYTVSPERFTAMKGTRTYTFTYAKVGADGKGRVRYRVEKPAEYKGSVFVSLFDAAGKRIFVMEGEWKELPIGTYRFTAAQYDRNYEVVPAEERFTLDAEHPEKDMVFTVRKKSVEKTYTLKWSDVGALEDFAALRLTITDDAKKATIPAEKTATGWTFRGAPDTEYSLVIDGVKNTFFPNVVRFASFEDNKTLNATARGDMTVEGKAGAKTVMVEYVVTLDVNLRDKIRYTDAALVPVSPNAKPYTVTLTKIPDGYALKDGESEKKTADFANAQEPPHVVFELRSTTSVDKSALEALLKEAPEVRKSARYVYDTAEKKAAYDDAVEKGQSVFDDEEATKDAVEAAVSAIRVAKDALSGIDPKNEKVERLKQLIREQPKVHETDAYKQATRDSRREYDAAIEDGKLLLDVLYTEAEIDEAIARIERAIEKLSPPDRSALQKAIAHAEEVRTGERYAQAEDRRKAEFDEALKLAKEIYAKADVSQAELDGAVQMLQDAERNLEHKTPDKAELKALLDEADDVRASKAYQEATPDAKFAYDKAINAGKNVYTDTYAGKDDVRRAVDAIRAAKEALYGHPVAEDKSALEKAIADAEAAKREDRYLYADADKKKALDDALRHAQEVLKNPGASPEEVANAEKALRAAIDALNGVAPAPGPQPLPDPSQPIVPTPGVDPRPFGPGTKPVPEKPAVPEAPKTPETPAIKRWEIALAQPSDRTLPFVDLTGDHPLDAIAKVYRYGLMEGTHADRFSPELPVSRAQMLTILYRLSTKKDVKTSEQFPDVHPGDWYADVAGWAKAMGIAKGDERGWLHPNRNMSLAELAAMLHRFLVQSGVTFEEKGSAPALQNLPDWAAEAVEVLSANHILYLPAPDADAVADVPRSDLARTLAQLIDFIEAHQPR